MKKRNHQRARRAVLVGLVLVLLVQVGLALALEWYGSSLHDSIYGQKVRQLKHRLKTGPARPLLAVQVGSSRTLNGMRGRAAEPWLARHLGRPVVLFNMGFVAAGPITNLLNTRRLLNEGIRPDLLLLEVFPAFLHDFQPIFEVQPDRLSTDWLRHGEMRLVARHAGADRPHVERDWWLARATCVSGSRLPLLARTAPTLLAPAVQGNALIEARLDDSGWLEMARPSSARLERAREHARSEYQWVLAGFRLSRRALAALAENIDLARQEGIMVALVLMPEGPTFRGWYPPGTWEAIERTIRQVSREHGVPLLNFREGMEEGSFIDSHHLDPEGAVLFARGLAERIEPLLRQAGERHDGASR
jgi:hypothetical protein